MIEREVVRVIREEFIRPEFHAALIKSAREQLKGGQGRTSAELKRFRMQREKAEKAKARWVAIFEQEGTGWETALERIEALTEEINALDNQIQELESTQRLSGEVVFSDSYFRDLLDRFEDTMQEGSHQDRRTLIRGVIEKIELGPKEIQPDGPWEREVGISLRVGNLGSTWRPQGDSNPRRRRERAIWRVPGNPRYSLQS